MSVEIMPVGDIKKAFKGVAKVKEDLTFSCQFCGQKASSGAGRSAHERWCKSNPQALVATKQRSRQPQESDKLSDLMQIMLQRLENSTVTIADFSAWKSLTQELWYKA